MEIKILKSILHKELMPWAFDTKGIKAVNDKIRKVGTKDPTNPTEAIKHLQLLLSDYPDLTTWLNKQNKNDLTPFKNHCFAIDLPDYPDAITKFYSSIISIETLRVYNAFITKIEKYKTKVDIVYNTTVALNDIRALAVDAIKKTKELGYEEEPTEESSLSHFVLHLLRKHLTILFFDIQELNITSFDNPTSAENFYLLELQLPKAQAKELSKVQIEKGKAEKPTTKETISFGFIGSEQKLKATLTQLVNKVELLKEDKCTVEHLVEILTAKALTTKMHKIYIGCETVQAVYIFENLKDYFSKSIPQTFEASKLFYTKGNTPFKAQNYYSNKIDNPKNQPIIDNILKQMQ